MAVMSDGAIVLGGNTYGNWDGTSARSGDFAAAKVDPDGQDNVWKWQASVHIHRNDLEHQWRQPSRARCCTKK